MDDKGKELCPRLIDYLVIVGRRSRSKCFSQLSIDGASSSQSVTAPELLRRYPTDDHKDFSLPTDVTVFCQPEGCIIRGAPRRTQSLPDGNSFVFTLTEKDSAKIRYGICFNFFQSFERPKANIDSNADVSNEKKFRRRMSLTSLCLISHHPFLSTFRELLLLLKKLIDGYNFNFRDSVWSALTGHWGDTIPPPVMYEIRELETWILMILSTPVPVPGKTKVQLEVMPLNIVPMLEFALPDHTRFSLVDFPLHLPLELLGIDTAVKVLAAVMLEYKVVLISRNYNAVSMCVLAIVSLLYPLEYMFPVIPLLPSYMLSAEQLLFAPTPFIIGMPASFFSQKNIDSVPNDVILVDLDTNQLIIPESITIPDMPEPDCSILKQSFRNALAKLKLASLDFDLDKGGNDFEASFIVDSDVVDVAVRVAMIHFFNSSNIFANFSEHTRTLRLYPRPVVALQTESFLRSRPNFTQFILELCRSTQAVEYFAESSLCPRNETYVRVQTGIEAPEQIGDKGKWFSEALMPVHFAAYPNDSTLADAWHVFLTAEQKNTLVIIAMLFLFEEASKPLAEVNDIYREPLTLELPRNDSSLSIGSSLSSGRSTPSSMSTSAMDSEADFARLAENLAIKTDAKGIAHLTDSGEKVLGPQLMSALNGYAEKSHDMINQMLHRTAPKAQAFRDKTVGPIAAAAANRMEQSQHLVKTKAKIFNVLSFELSNFSKNQQIVRDVCDQVLAGQGIGVFTYAKLRRLMEDESLRQLVCSKLNLGLDIKHSEEDFVQEMQLMKSQYKGYIKVLQTCINGLDYSFITPGSNGLASMFHILEIAHTHFWAKESDITTPLSGIASQALSISDYSGPFCIEKIFTYGPPPPLPPRPKKSTDEAMKRLSITNDSISVFPLTSRANSLGAIEPLLQLQPPKSLPISRESIVTVNRSPDCPRHYIYQDLILPSPNPLWHKMAFWESAFFDVVAQERDIIGMDQEPCEMIDRYSGLSESEKRRLELDEDRLLATLLHNLTAYMIMCGTGQKAIQQKIRRLLGKAHIGLVYSKTINHLLDHLPQTQSNGIPLKPLGSRLMQKQSFTVYSGSNADGSMMFLEVCDDAVVLRAVTGAITERWWYERLVNMTYSPKTRVLCLWRRHEGKVHMHKFYTKKCRELYSCMKTAMERAAARGKVPIAGKGDLGGEFPVHDAASNEGGLLQVRIDGVYNKYLIAQHNLIHFIDLANIKKCNTFGGNVFILEEYGDFF
ncbi:unnamed protein product [Dracunculus medinensis]|uniref:MAP kinase-activating death domain protein n=1 Tax=Dracunculus medinensis TaxID=318479 RepID=A0A0N4U509_DRAME|nr:unnamed protein product [Dracunculus medinensis]